MNVWSCFKAAAALAGASLAVFGPAAWATSDGHAIVSSDGSVPPAAESAARGSAAFQGRAAAGGASDALAEFPASRFDAEALAAFQAHFKPKLPPYGAPQAEKVVGPDRRLRAYPRESGFPYRAIGMLTFNQFGGSGYLCTGWLISRDTVVTAGHCVHEGPTGGAWSTNVRFFPAMNGGVAPFGSCTARRLYSVTGWTSSGSADYDYGAVKLNCSVGTSTGWFGYYAASASQQGLPVQVIGYPGDKPFGTMWAGAGAVTVSEPRRTYYTIDTFGGQSGSPVIESDRGASAANCYGACGVAIHAYGLRSTDLNSGTRINAEVAANLNAWKNAR